MNKSESNRRNGQLSTGPKTVKGMAISSKNAMKHGLTSREVVLESESIEAYDELLSDLMNTFKPFGPVERLLVTRIAQCTWRLQRVMKIETQLLDAGTQDYAGLSLGFFRGSRPIGIGDVFKPLASGNVIGNVMKYEAHCERALYRALNDLERIQMLRSSSSSTLDVGLLRGGKCSDLSE